MLPHPQADDGFAVGQITQQANGVLRADARLLRHLEGVSLPQAGHVRKPVTVLLAFGAADQLLQSGLDVGADRQGHCLVLVEFVAVDVYVDDTAVGNELFHVTGHPVVEATPRASTRSASLTATLAY